jgi:hypothetical protein
MDILGKVKNAINEGVEFVESIPTEAVDTAYNLANTVYYKATGHSLGKPLHSKMEVNNATKKLFGRKVFKNIPTTDELQNPDTAKKYFTKAVNENNKELLEITLQKALENPSTAEAVLKQADEDFYNRVNAVFKNKASEKDKTVLARELNLLSELAKNPEIGKKLSKTTSVITTLNDNDWLKKHPELLGVKETIDKYNTVNKTLDYINLLSVATFGASKIGVRVFKTPLLKAVSHVVAGASAGTPLATGAYKSSVNHESFLQSVSPLDVWMAGDVIRSGKEILKTKEAIFSYDMYKQLQDPNFNPTEHLITQLSQKYDLTDAELQEFQQAVLSTQKSEFSKFDNIYQILAKNTDEKYSAILRRVISRKSFEDEMIKYHNQIIQALLNHKPLVEHITKNYSKNGKIVIDDVNKLEEELYQMSKTDPTIANFMKYNRQSNLLGELTNAIEHGNKEVVISIIRPSAIKKPSEVEGETSAVGDKIAEEVLPLEDKVIDLSQPLKSIIDEVEKEFMQNATVSITYKTKAGDTISRTIKAFYTPTNAQFRILKGKFQVLKDGEWKEIEDTFTIPITRTHEIETALKEIAKEKGYDDIKFEKEAVEYIKPSTTVFPHKLVRLADRLLKLENTLLKNNQKVKVKEVKEFKNLVEEAYESGYLPHIVKKEVNGEEVGFLYPLDYYLEAKPDVVFKTLKESIINHTKDIISRSKEASGNLKEVIFDEGGSLLKFVENEMKEYSQMFKDVEKDIYSQTKDYTELGKTFSKILTNYVKEVGDSVKQMKSSTLKIKNDVKSYIKDDGSQLSKMINHELKQLEELSKTLGSKVFKLAEAKDIKLGVKGYNKLGDEVISEIGKTDKEIKEITSKIKNSLNNINKLTQEYTKQSGVDLLNNIKTDLQLLDDITQKLKSKDLYTSVKGFIELGKEGYKDYASRMEEVKNKIKDLSNLAKTLTSAEKVSLKDTIKLTDVIDKSALKIDTIADTIKKIATTPYQEMNREGKGFATTFDNYESFKAYASLKYLSPTFKHLKSIPFLNKLLEELETLEKYNPHSLNPTQKLVKDFLKLYLHKDVSDFTKAQRILGNLITLLNPSIALGNFVAGLQALHSLFPSLELMKIGEIKHVWNNEFKKMLYAEGLYKYNVLNPFYTGIETILKSHILANVKDDKIFNNVILDYAKSLGIKDEKVIETLKATYQDRREALAEDIVNYISGLDAGALQAFAIQFGKIGEAIMPWYRFIFTPFAIAIQTIRNWKETPEYIQRYGIGKTVGKALAFSTFSAIALGSQAVPIMAPVESAYEIGKTFINTLAVLFGEDEIFTDRNFADLVLRELDYNVLKTGLFDPNERVNFYTSFGSALLQAIAGAEASSWDSNPFIHSLRVGLDFISKIGASGVISPTAGSYVADIPAPALSIIQNIVKKTMFATDEQSQQTQFILALLQSVPITNNIYKEVAGKTLVKGVGESGKEEIWQPSLPAELLSKEGQGIIGLAHLVGFMLLHADTIFNGAEIQKATQLFRYELATDEEKKQMFNPVKNPPSTDYYKFLNFKDYNVFRNKPEDIIATLRYIPEEDLPKVKTRADELIIKNLNKIVKIVREGKFTDKEITEIKHRYEALQNYIIVADYLGWDKVSDNLSLDKIKELHKTAYQVLKEKGIDVDYKDIIRVKRKLMETNKIGS